jgi:midasin
LLQGETSCGKTSAIEYLAKATHNKCIRINNHQHTDVEEYIGSYVPDKTGKLQFQEGALVEALRNGYWIILDELNLAPSEVLEALNRLLDDNREIFIVETQTYVKAHPNFRLFGTQNPSEGYAGRKELSEAFKNRFIMINVYDIPSSELETIIHKRCAVAPTHAKKMV